MFIGGLRALLLQTLHPAAMRGVAEHSDYRHDAWGRLARTSRFIAVTTFGTADDAAQAVAAVRTIHERIVGTMPDGTAYAASDPHLLAWVHVAEVDSFLRAHTVYGRDPLTGAERDEYVAQTAEVARRLGVVDPPTTEAELAATLAAYRPELHSTPEARATVGYLLVRPPLPLPARAPYAVIAAAAVGLMPRWTRRPLRLPWFPVSERTVVRALGGVATGTIRWAMTPREPAHPS
ncbi:oxygenase MpaB family protein [Nocardioides hankookensis]